jgi:hypothetical protein
VNKVTEGRPHVVDMIKNGEIALIVNTVEEKRTAITDSRSIRTSALGAKVTCSPPSRAGAPPVPACATTVWRPIHCNPCIRNFRHEQVPDHGARRRACCARNCSD